MAIRQRLSAERSGIDRLAAPSQTEINPSVTPRLRFTELAGILTPAIGVSQVFMAAHRKSKAGKSVQESGTANWWREYTLSSLKKDGRLFTLATTEAGLGTILFSRIMRRHDHDDPINRASTSLIGLSGAALVGIAFTEGRSHEQNAIVFFAGVPTAMVIWGIDTLVNGSRIGGTLTIAAALAAGSTAIFGSKNGKISAMHESIHIGTVIAWSVVAGTIKLISEKDRTT